MGFIKAFKLADISQLSQTISKPKGVLWLLTALLFELSLLLFLYSKNLWWLFGFVSITVSQYLIFSSWQDARFGTVVNLIFFLVCLIGFADWNFERKVKEELTGISLNIKQNEAVPYKQKTLTQLPEVIQMWLSQSKSADHTEAHIVHLWQTGRMKLKPDGDWMNVRSQQWFTIHEPGFIWSAEVGEGSLLRFAGLDKYVNGKGSMLIKLYSLFPIVEEEGKNIDQGVMVRYLSEIIWFPSAALNNYISWKEIDPLRIEATFTYNELSVSGIFTFNGKGMPASFQAQRYYDKTGSPETWFISIDENSFRKFNTYFIPTKASVTWKLQGGDFKWYELEIMDLVEE
jgi:hypothetical protein